ncbi:hypothetical protein HDV06_000787 [Boothiomyces sp. JEL0866]|nr:hypothetical protein HDV06_000787 [Boothiomyces sp. JEL0866]
MSTTINYQSFTYAYGRNCLECTLDVTNCMSRPCNSTSYYQQWEVQYYTSTATIINHGSESCLSARGYGETLYLAYCGIEDIQKNWIALQGRGFMSFQLNGTVNSCAGIIDNYGTIGIVDCDPNDIDQQFAVSPAMHLQPYPTSIPEPRTISSTFTPFMGNNSATPTGTSLPPMFTIAPGPVSPSTYHSSSDNSDLTGLYAVAIILLTISFSLRIWCCLKRAEKRKKLQTQIDEQLAAGKKLHEITIDGVPVQPEAQNRVEPMDNIPVVELDSILNKQQEEPVNQ